MSFGMPELVILLTGFSVILMFIYVLGGLFKPNGSQSPNPVTSQSFCHDPRKTTKPMPWLAVLKNTFFLSGMRLLLSTDEADYDDYRFFDADWNRLWQSDFRSSPIFRPHKDGSRFLLAQNRLIPTRRCFVDIHLQKAANRNRCAIL